MSGIIDRRRYAGVAAGEYIQEGLVFWLDGIDKGDDPAVWTDLIGGIRFPLNGGQELRRDSVRFDGTAGLTSASPSLSLPMGSSQLEVVVNQRRNGTMIIHPNRSNVLCFGFFDSTTILGASAPLSYLARYPNGKVSYSMSYQQLHYNGTEAPRSQRNYWGIGTRDVYEVGHRAKKLLYTGDIFCIRIYDRILTEEERMHNLKIDRIRFRI